MKDKMIFKIRKIYKEYKMIVSLRNVTQKYLKTVNLFIIAKKQFCGMSVNTDSDILASYIPFTSE